MKSFNGLDNPCPTSRSIHHKRCVHDRSDCLASTELIGRWARVVFGFERMHRLWELKERQTGAAYAAPIAWVNGSSSSAAMPLVSADR